MSLIFCMIMYCCTMYCFIQHELLYAIDFYFQYSGVTAIKCRYPCTRSGVYNLIAGDQRSDSAGLGITACTRPTVFCLVAGDQRNDSSGLR